MALWTPDNLTSLRAWYKADNLSLSNNDPVDSWTDSSGGGYTLTASSGDRPTFKTSTLNSLPVVEYSGSNRIRAATASDWNFLHQSGGSTIVAVWKAGTSSDPNAAYALLGTTNDQPNTHGLQVSYDDRSSLSRNDTLRSAIGRGATPIVSNNFTSNDAFPANTPGIVSVTSDPGNATAASRSSIRVNGGNATEANTNTDSPSTSNASFALALGSAGDQALRLVGYIAEVVICNAKLSDSDRQLLEGYLAWKWGLEGNLPAGHPYKSAAPTVGDVSNRRRREISGGLL